MCAGVVAQTLSPSIDYFPVAPVDFVCFAPAVEMLNPLVNLRAATSSAFVPLSADFDSTVFYVKAGKFASFPPDYYLLL